MMFSKFKISAFELLNRVVQPSDLIEGCESLYNLNAIGNGGFANSVRAWLSVVQINDNAKLFWRTRDHLTSAIDLKSLKFITDFDYLEILKGRHYASWVIIPQKVNNFSYIYNCINKLGLYKSLNFTDDLNEYRSTLANYYKMNTQFQRLSMDNSKYIGIHLRSWTDLIKKDGIINVPNNQDYGAYIAKTYIDKKTIKNLALKIQNVASTTGISRFYCASDNNNLKFFLCDLIENLGLKSIEINDEDNSSMLNDFELLRNSNVLFRTPGSTFSHLPILLSNTIEFDYFIS
jgi:hypothetical protein